jgi:hypothetical protein
LAGRPRSRKSDTGPPPLRAKSQSFGGPLYSPREDLLCRRFTNGIEGDFFMSCRISPNDIVSVTAQC